MLPNEDIEIVYNYPFAKAIQQFIAGLLIGGIVLGLLAWASSPGSQTVQVWEGIEISWKWLLAALMFLVWSLSLGQEVRSLTCKIDHLRLVVLCECRRLNANSEVAVPLLDIIFIERRVKWRLVGRTGSSCYSLIAYTPTEQISLIENHPSLSVVRGIQDRLERVLQELPGSRFSREVPERLTEEN